MICKCGSQAINIDPKRKECDVCFYKNKLAVIYEIILGTEAQGVNFSSKKAWKHDVALNEIMNIVAIGNEGG